MEEIGKRIGVLSLTIKDKAILQTAYMPFLTQGGLFIPTTRAIPMGEEIEMIINIIDDPEKYSVKGIVVWLTPKGAQGNRAQGIGVQFIGAEAYNIKNKIESYLGNALKSANATHTL